MHLMMSLRSDEKWTKIEADGWRGRAFSAYKKGGDISVRCEALP